MNDKKYKLSGMQIFKLIWFGQFISIMGTAMTRFALIIWAYEQTGTATTTALLGFFSYLPYILLCPLAGVIVDRYSRKKILILSDLCAGIMTVILFLLYKSGNLEVWHLFLAEAVASSFEAFQIPAFSSTISLLISKENYIKASGMRSFSSYCSTVLAPILGGIFVLKIGVNGVMLIDIVTFVVAIGIMMRVTLPNPERKSCNEETKVTLIEEMKVGFQYLREFKGLMHLMLLYVEVNFFAALTYFGILPAMILARSGSDRIALASVQSALGIGGIVGSFIVSTRKGSSRKVNIIVISGIGSFLFGDLLLAIGRSYHWWIVGAFLSSLFLPFMSSAYESIWQSKVEPALQGRVFSTRDMMQMASMPIGFILGGFLADHVFEPAMATSWNLSNFLSRFVGSGKGAGMAAMFLLTCICGTCVCLSGYFNKNLKDLND